MTPERSRGALAHQVEALLRDTYLSGQLPPGAKLPSEAELTRRYDVSRTVIREAVAVLRAKGLVRARQGSGVFVIAPPPPEDATGRADLGTIDIRAERLSEVLELLELRMAVECESAALAAERRAPAQEEAIWERLVEMTAPSPDTGSRAEPGVRASSSALDLAFHMAIAEATNNARFVWMLHTLGSHSIPRAAIGLERDGRVSDAYLAMIAREHSAIADAISAKDVDASRCAMHAHLAGSIRRYRDAMRQPARPDLVADEEAAHDA